MIRRLRPLALALFLVGALDFEAGATDQEAASPPVKVTSVEGITEYRLANGLRVLLFPDPTRQKFTVNLTVLVGSRHEGYGETGMAHLLEHMLFKGTATHPNIPAALKERAPASTARPGSTARTTSRSCRPATTTSSSHSGSRPTAW